MKENRSLSITGPPTLSPPVGSGPTGAQAGSADVQTIVAAHLFGQASAEPVVTVVPDEPLEDLAETRLALTLKGTMAGSDNRLTQPQHDVVQEHHDQAHHETGQLAVPPVGGAKGEPDQSELEYETGNFD